MPLQLYNTSTRRKETFAPIDPARVGLYVCGPTVYDRAHIGNARPVIVFDVLFRLLRHLYGADHVRYVRNITDVDDKIIARAAERGVPIAELTEGTAREFNADTAALGCLPPTVEPRATEHIPEMIAVVARLVDAGHAYVADGHVLFDVSSSPDYGRLSRRTLDEMVAGARVEVASYKRGETDFVLWKPAKADEPGWDSPWGRGRPGWHIECSAMSWKHLGETFDIHGGGIDLLFPHHENELAQNRCAFHQPFMAKTWMHNGFLQVEGRKMSKSLGNFVTIHDLLAQQPKYRYWRDIVRLNMLRTHYRQPIDWTDRSLAESEVIYLDILNAMSGSARGRARPNELIVEKLLDDLNTPEGVSELQRLASRSRSGVDPFDAAAELIATMDLLGFQASLQVTMEDSGVRDAIEQAIAEIRDQGMTQSVNASLVSGSAVRAEALRKKVHDAIAKKEARDAGVDLELVDELVSLRKVARAARNWAESDRIRDELAALGVSLKDDKSGTTSWRVGRAGRA